MFNLNNLKAQPLILGTSSEGGAAFGTIFHTDIDHQDFKTFHHFEGISGANPIYNVLVEANNGLLYGLTSKGGRNDHGVLFSYNPQTNDYKTLIHFNRFENGAEPRGSLIKTSDGKLWGMCSFGGQNNNGTIFVFDTDSNILTKKFDFSNPNGAAPFGQLCQYNNKLFGMTYQGGSSNLGVLFEFDMQLDSFSKKIDFNGTNGQNPFGSLILANNNKLYGLTYQGGVFGQGTIIEYNPQNDSLIKKKDFNPTLTGSNPYGNLLQAQNGRFYGMAFLGGANNNGSIFEYNLQTDSLIRKFSFSTSLGTGQNPYGNLIEISNGKFLGTTIQGSLNNGGALFEWNNNINSYQVLHRFSNASNGRNPQGSLQKHSNGKFYGLTNRGGQTNFGVIFEFDTFNNVVTKKLDLNVKQNGGYPLSNLSNFSKNNDLFGTTSSGGSNYAGSIFKINIEQQQYIKLYDFNAITDGANPQCRMIEAPNKKLYGLNLNGGSQNNGTLYEFNPKDSIFSKKIDFQGTTNGKNPHAALTVFNDSLLYGMTSLGGINDYGVIFKYNINQNTLIKVYDFDDTFSGSNPLSQLLLASDNQLYGTTFSGGQYQLGVFFKFNPSTNVFEKLIDFNGFNNGSYPQSSLVEIDNKIYGTTRFGGRNNDGILYVYDLNSSSLTVLNHFEDSIGLQPVGELLNINNQILSGTCFLGGENNAGSIFEYQLNNSALKAKVHFNVENGSKPLGGLIKACIPYRDTIQITVCDSFELFSKTSMIYESGVLNDTLSSLSGCDSILNIKLVVNKSSSSLIDTAVCDSYIDPIGNILDSSGVFYYKLANHLACDSIITLNLKIKNSSSFLHYSTCDSFIAANGSVFNQSGDYKIVIPNYLNCDSTINFKLTVLKSSSLMNVTSCFSYVLPDGKIVDSSGNYIVSLKNQYNCDSNITVQVQITKPNISVVYNDSVLVAQETDCNYQWINCLTQTEILNATQKEFKPNFNGLFAVIINKNNCIDTSNCFNVNNLSVENMFFDNDFIQLYPNPNQGSVFIKVNNILLNKAILYDFSGKEIKTFELNGSTLEQIHFYEFENGIYFIKIMNQNNYKVFKINKMN